MIRLPRMVLCLDWDRRALRMVVARVGSGRIALEDAHSHRLPPNLDADDAKAMGEFIARMIQRHRWKHRRVIVDIPRERVVINTLTLPPTPTEELASVVQFQAIRELPFPVDEGVIDFAVTAREGKNLVTQVLLAAVRKETLERVRETCVAAGLTPARVGLRPFANVCSVMRACNAATRRVMMVDVGPALTEIDIVRGGVLSFSRSANVSIPSMQATDILVSEDSRVSSKADLLGVAASEEAMDEAVESLLVEITRTLQAFRATEPTAALDEIVVAGGTGVEPKAVPAIAARLSLPCKLFDPSGALGVGPGDGAKLRAFSAALGLAWGLGKEGRLEIDFLNPKKPVPPRQSFKRRLRFATAAAGVLAVGGAATGVMKYSALSRELEATSEQVTEWTKEVKGLVEIRNAVEEVDEWAREGVWLDDLLRISEQAISPGEKMRVSNISFNERGVISLSLMAADQQTHTDFSARLNGVPGYTARARDWSGRETVAEKFHGAGKVEVIVNALDRHMSQQAKREQDRKERLKEKNLTRPLPAGGKGVSP